MVISAIGRGVAKAVRRKLSEGAKEIIREATRGNLNQSRQISKAGKRGDFGSPRASKAAAKELKTGAKEMSVGMGLLTTNLYKKYGSKPFEEARKYLKSKKVEARKDKEYMRKMGLKKGGMSKGKKYI
tara:strand:+ start:188 stop:571 length:384 start_codon:yes stop_codon:yes gene_type:complete